MIKPSIENLSFLKKLFISLITDIYSLNDLENLIGQKIVPSEFFSFMQFNFDRINSLDFALSSEFEFLETKDDPSFELQYKIFTFYSTLSPKERLLLYNHYSDKLSINELEIPTNFNAEEVRIPNYLLNFLFTNSISFFDEFDVSDGFIEVEDLLITAEIYTTRLRITTDNLNFEIT